MIAFNGDAKLQADFIAGMEWHYEQDRIRQRTYGRTCSEEEFRGCAIACGIHTLALMRGENLDTSEHKNWELIGVPEWLARLIDSVFEGLSVDEAREFPVQFARAIRLGKDLDSIKPGIMIYILQSCRSNADVNGKAAIDQVILLWGRVQSGQSVSDDEWSAAESAAQSAESAVWSAAESAVWSAARSAW